MPDHPPIHPSPASPAGSASDHPSGAGQPEVRASLRRYWRSNVRIMVVLLGVWALVGLGCGVLFADRLNAYQFAGFPLGFWFAQQGSILVFLLLILVYGLLLNRLDARHLAELQALRRQGGEKQP